MGRTTNFMIVEITPIGIQNLGWKFWIVWTVFNSIFLPIIYLFYPETRPQSPATVPRPLKDCMTLKRAKRQKTIQWPHKTTKLQRQVALRRPVCWYRGLSKSWLVQPQHALQPAFAPPLTAAIPADSAEWNLCGDLYDLLQPSTN